MPFERINRRRMLQSTGAAVAAITAAPLNLVAAKIGRPRLRIGACDWSLGKRCDPGSFAMAREIGLDGVQVSLGTEANDLKLREASVQEAFKRKAMDARVAVASLAIGELNNVPYKSDPRTEVWVRDSIAVMQSLGVKVVLLAFFSKGDLRHDDPGVAEVVRRLKTVAPAAEKAGVVFGLESWLSAEETVRIMDRVGSPALKMYYDVCNSTERGYDVPKEIRWLGRKRICEFHMKENGKLLGQGDVDFKKVRDAIHDIGYEGWMQIEGAVPPGAKLIESYRRNLDYLRNLFSPS